jgi:hypothetical protein
MSDASEPGDAAATGDGGGDAALAGDLGGGGDAARAGEHDGGVLGNLPAHQRALAVALLASLLLWNLPYGGLIFYPFKLLATWFHELSHGVLMLITGAGFDRMEIYRDTSGLAYAQYGVGAGGRAAIAAAGYMGTPLFGAALLVLGRSRRGARAVLLGLGALLLLSGLVWVSNRFGMASVLGGAGLCIGLALVGGVRLNHFVVNFVAAQACVNAVLDVRVLFRTNLVVNGQVMGASDAHNMAKATFGNHWLWATVWLLWAFAVLFVALRWLHRQPPEPASG